MYFYRSLKNDLYACVCVYEGVACASAGMSVRSENNFMALVLMLALSWGSRTELRVSDRLGNSLYTLSPNGIFLV